MAVSLGLSCAARLHCVVCKEAEEADRAAEQSRVGKEAAYSCAGVSGRA